MKHLASARDHRGVTLAALFMLTTVLRSEAAGAKTFTVHLRPENRSDETGTAVFESVGSSTRITIAVRGENPGAVQPARINAGTCAAIAQTSYTLQDVRDGRSTTVLPVPLEKLTTGAYVIELQSSQASLRAAKDYKYVSCGAIGAGA